MIEGQRRGGWGSGTSSDSTGSVGTVALSQTGLWLRLNQEQWSESWVFSGRLRPEPCGTAGDRPQQHTGLGVKLTYTRKTNTHRTSLSQSLCFDNLRGLFVSYNGIQCHFSRHFFKEYYVTTTNERRKRRKKKIQWTIIFHKTIKWYPHFHIGCHRGSTLGLVLT